MPKRTFPQIRLAIMLAVKDGAYHSYAELERKVNTNWKTVLMHCEDLALFNAITVKDGKVKIREEGLAILQKLMKEKAYR